MQTESLEGGEKWQTLTSLRRRGDWETLWWT